MLVIIDYNIGNLGSIKNMLKKIGAESVISSDENIINDADKIILAGVGAFDYGMSKLREYNLVELLNKKVLSDKIPVLGICLGLQLFTRRSEEGKMNGLGWLDAETVKFNFENYPDKLKIPNIGWNNVSYDSSSKLFLKMPDEARFYFVHSYHVRTDFPSEVICKARYGYEFVAGLEKENIMGVQFHPEKSHKFGMKIMKNFCELY